MESLRYTTNNHINQKLLFFGLSFSDLVKVGILFVGLLLGFLFLSNAPIAGYLFFFLLLLGLTALIGCILFFQIQSSKNHPSYWASKKAYRRQPKFLYDFSNVLNTLQKTSSTS